MNVTLCSAFRNSASYIGRYLSQIDGLCDALTARDGKLNVIIAHGDSSDKTGEILRDSALYKAAVGQLHFKANIFECNHGGQDYGSVVNAERFANLAKVWGQIWQRIPEDADAVLFCESDLIWEPETMLALLDDLEHVPAVAPLVLLEREGYPPSYFYDTWAFRKNGRHFGPHIPYWVSDFPFEDLSRPIELDSAGSCIAMRGDVARGLVWPAEDVVVGICRQIRERGGSVWLDPMQKVVHQ